HGPPRANGAGRGRGTRRARSHRYHNEYPRQDTGRRQRRLHGRQRRHRRLVAEPQPALSVFEFGAAIAGDGRDECFETAGECGPGSKGPASPLSPARRRSFPSCSATPPSPPAWPTNCSAAAFMPSASAIRWCRLARRGFACKSRRRIPKSKSIRPLPRSGTWAANSARLSDLLLPVAVGPLHALKHLEAVVSQQAENDRRPQRALIVHGKLVDPFDAALPLVDDAD